MAYIYRHIRLDKNEPFYIGRSSCEDGYKRSREYHNRNTLWNRVCAKTDYEVEIIMDGLTHEESIQKEIEFIKLYGRKDNRTGTLCNMSDGGDGYRDNSRPIKHQDMIDEWLKLFNEGWMVPEISEKFDVPATSVAKQIRLKYGAEAQDPWAVLERHCNKSTSDKCWNWTGSMAQYPEMVIRGEKINPARHNYEELFGQCEYPLLRKCKNKMCTNPWHMKPRRRND